MNRHTLCHAALAAIYGLTALVLLLEGTLAEAACAFAAAVIYATLTDTHHHVAPQPPDQARLATPPGQNPLGEN